MDRLLTSRLALIAVLALQLFCAVFFLFDGVLDVLGPVMPTGLTLGLSQGDLFEWLLGLALVVSVIVTALQVRRLLRDQRRMKNALQAASGAVGEFLQHQFRDWDLSPSESDVALFAIKGSSIAEIARMRGTGRHHQGPTQRDLPQSRGHRPAPLISFFIDEMVDGIAPAARAELAADTASDFED